MGPLCLSCLLYMPLLLLPHHYHYFPHSIIFLIIFLIPVHNCDISFRWTKNFRPVFPSPLRSRWCVSREVCLGLDPITNRGKGRVFDQYNYYGKIHGEIAQRGPYWRTFYMLPWEVNCTRNTYPVSEYVRKKGWSSAAWGQSYLIVMEILPTARYTSNTYHALTHI